MSVALAAVVSNRVVGLLLCGICCLLPARSEAQIAALLAVGDGAKLSELQLAKVMADDSSLWLSVRVSGQTRLALVTAESAIEPAPAAHAWLQALDFATRVRVAPPLGPLASCGTVQRFEPIDTGLPEAPRVAAFDVSSETTELGLRRRLANAGLPADIERIAQFTSTAQPPFRVAIYDVPAAGGGTDTVRLRDQGHPTTLPRLVLSGASTVPLSLIALASDGVQLTDQESVDPSELPVVYRAADASSDYVSARADWLAQNPTRWLNEVQASAPLFAGTVFPSGQRIESVIARYFADSRNESASACETRARAALERTSSNAEDFGCDGADDLARTLSEVGFAEPRTSRFFARLGADGALRVVANGSRSPLLFATDFDQTGCSNQVSPPVYTPDTPTTPLPARPMPVVISDPDDPYHGSVPVSVTTTVYTDDSCTWSNSSSSSDDSCSGDSSSSESSSDDSCSGDSSSSESSTDSCSGDSSSESSSDSCDGDSSDSKYDGDTCSGDSAESNSARTKSAALHAPSARGQRARPRPRPVRLSLVTLLAAALSLPLRRRCASR